MIVRCERLVQIFQTEESEVQALQGLDLSIAAGEAVALVGSSGSGKSTLLNVIGGLVRPTGGRVEVADLDLGEASSGELDRHRRDTVGFVWQQTARNLLPSERAVDNIALVASIGGSANPASIARDLLDEVGLADRASQRISELSGGEQQRVAIAVALANDPAVLLADEPTGELDDATRDEIYALFEQLRRDRGVTQILASHDPGVHQHVDRVIELRDGAAVAERHSHASTSAEADLLLVDTAGRIRLPREVLDAVGIDDRARLEVDDDHIRLRRTDG